jgi:hypothetical protein
MKLCAFMKNAIVTGSVSRLRCERDRAALPAGIRIGCAEKREMNSCVHFFAMATAPKKDPQPRL